MAEAPSHLSESAGVPTDAQGRLLAVVEHHQPCFVGSKSVWVEGTPSVLAGSGLIAQFPKARVHPATSRIAFESGWLALDLSSPARSGFGASKTFAVSLTEDGVIALGRWRQRKMAEPIPAAPTLEGRDREVVALAEHALRLGYQLVPTTDDAKKHARQLKRAGWVERDYTSVSTMSVVPSASGLIEVNPDAADVAPIL